MVIGLTLAGFFFGLMLMSGFHQLFGALGGGLLGYILAQVISLGRRADSLQTELDHLKGRLTGNLGDEIPEPVQDEPTAETPIAESLPGVPQAAPQDYRDFEPPAHVPSPKGPEFSSVVAARLKKISTWFTSGNVPVKVGVLISFIGVSFFLKYAIDKELLSVPIEFRLMGVAVAAVLMIFIGWRLREKLRAYALSMQGGGIGILFLTIFAAFRIWELMPAGLAFGLLVALAAGTGALSVLQKSKWLIILGAVGGFLAPVLASTGQGSHVTLFSYYLVLNATILGVSWFHAWRAVNLVGFLFTFVIGGFWGYQYYRPELFASTEPFLILFFLFYQAIAILYALRQPPEKIGLVDGTLVFGTPVITFALQAALVDGIEYGLAISAAVLAVFYALTATWLRRHDGNYLKVLSDSLIALAVAFATITIPLALDAGWTAATWALEGAALIWIATRQPQHLANWAGTLLIVFSGFAFVLHGWRYHEGWPVLNGNVFGGVLISLSALFGAYRLRDFQHPPLPRLYRWMAWFLFGWGVLWWLGTGIAEIDDHLSLPIEAHATLLFMAISAAGFAWLGRTRDWNMPRILTLLFLPTLFWVAAWYADWQDHFLFGLGWLAWLLAIGVQVVLLKIMDARASRLAWAWHVATALGLTAFLMIEIAWQVGTNIPGTWNVAAAGFIPGLVALLIWRFRSRPDWPVPTHPVSYRGLGLALTAGQAIYLALASVALPGSSGTISYIPVLNPLDLATLFAALAALMSLIVMKRDHALLRASVVGSWLPAYKVLMALAFFVLTTMALVRGVHHLAGIPWNPDRLSDSVIVQTSLSIYWGLLGFTGMVVGARRSLRWVWLIGAGFMGLVVIKLFLIDLGNSGTIERIISFIGIGVLLLVVGYFAPAPPRQPEAEE